MELVEFAKTGNLSGVRECVLKDRYDVNARCPPDGSTALYWAACCGQIGVCEWLINNGAEIDRATDKSGSTPLHGAADRGHYDCVALLLRRGSRLDQPTTANGDTALHLASYRGHFDICRLLLEHGASLTVSNKQGRTALEESQIKGHEKVSRLLLLRHKARQEKKSMMDDDVSDCLDRHRSQRISASVAGVIDLESAWKMGRDTEKEKKSMMEDAVSNCLDRHRSQGISTSMAGVVGLESVREKRRDILSHVPLQSEGKRSPFGAFSSGMDVADDASTSEKEGTSELVRHLRMKISKLESYAEALQAELTVRDDDLIQLRRENVVLRRMLDSPKDSAFKFQEVELPTLQKKAELCAARAASAERELEEVKRQCEEMERMVQGASRELNDCI